MPAPKHVESRLRELALAYPETREDFPWGERVIKVKDKIFLFMRADAKGSGPVNVDAVVDVLRRSRRDQ